MREVLISICLILDSVLLNGKGGVPSFTINPKNCDDISCFFAGKPEIIPLGSDSFAVGGIDKAIVKDGYVLTLDEKQNSISIFEAGTGKGLLQIKRQGSGSGEYVELSDIDFYGGKIYALSPSSREVIIYDLSGNCVEETKLDDIFYHLKVIDDSSIWLCGIKGTKKGYSFALYDISKHKIIQWRDKFKVQSSYMLRDSKSFGGKSGEGYYYSQPFSPTISLLDKSGTRPVANINIDLNNNISQKDLASKSLSDLADQYRTRDHLRFLSGMVEKNGFLHVVASYAFSFKSEL